MSPDPFSRREKGKGSATPDYFLSWVGGQHGLIDGLLAAVFAVHAGTKVSGNLPAGL